MKARNPVQTFLNEAEDLLGRIEEIALELKPGGTDSELINQLFRAFHTLKGSGAMFGFDAVAEFTHHVETLLDKVREGTVTISEPLIEAILKSQDHIKSLLEAARNETTPPTNGDEIIVKLKNLLPETASLNQNPRPAVAPRSENAAKSAAAEQVFSIRFCPNPTMMASGSDPIALLNELRALGECRVIAETGAVPPLAELQPDNCYFSWNITLKTARGLDAIKDVFIFVEDGSTLEITLGENQAGAVDKSQEKPALIAETRPAMENPESSPPSSSKESPARTRKNDGFVRVPSERLDRLVSLVGELVMNQSRLTQVAERASVPNLTAPVEELERLVAELRDTVLGIRMMPIGTTFGRFKRLVHDLSRELGKEIELITEGAETELDKTVLDQLGDPLVHVIRNSIDHGIEAPEARTEVGKPRCGIIRLTAAHVGSNVVITISDDGRGLDADAVRAKAIEKGLIAADAPFSERAMHEMIFRPGFSTAKMVTGVSGRGVGMDVVKRQFEALRGQVSIASETGHGTILTLTLPLTLAIIDGLLVEIGRDQFIVPMSVVTENVEIHRADCGRNNGRNAIAVRGELVPYICLRELFAIKGGEPDIEKIVITRHGEDRVGLVVDRVLGSHQTVIQPLGRFYRDINLVSGATIMGDGRVALILDLAGLVGVAEHQRRERISISDNLETTTAPSCRGANRN